jgi:hypothetical protein
MRITGFRTKSDVSISHRRMAVRQHLRFNEDTMGHDGLPVMDAQLDCICRTASTTVRRTGSGDYSRDRSRCGSQRAWEDEA